MNTAEHTLEPLGSENTAISKKPDSIAVFLQRMTTQIHVAEFANSVHSGDQYRKYLKGLLRRFVSDLSVYASIHYEHFVLRDPSDSIEKWLQQNAQENQKSELIAFFDAVSQRHQALEKSVRNYFSFDDRTRSKRIEAMQKELQFLLTSLHGDASNRSLVWRNGLEQILCLFVGDRERLEQWWNTDTQLMLDCLSFAPRDGWLDIKKDPTRFFELTGWPYNPIGDE